MTTARRDAYEISSLVIIDHDTCTTVSNATFPPVIPRFSRSCAHPAGMPDPAGKKLCCVYPHVCARYGATKGRIGNTKRSWLRTAATAVAPRRAPIDPGPPSHLSDASVAADASDAVCSYFTVPGAAEVSGLVTAPLGGFTGSGSLDGGDESGGERFHRRPADPCAPAIGDEPAIVSRDSTCPAPFIGGIDASAARSASAFAASTSRSAASSSSTRVSNHGGGGGRGGVFGGGLGGLGGGAGAWWWRWRARQEVEVPEAEPEEAAGALTTPRPPRRRGRGRPSHGRPSHV